MELYVIRDPGRVRGEQDKLGSNDPACILRDPFGKFPALPDAYSLHIEGWEE